MSRSGVALPVLLLVVLALTALSHGALLLAREALGSARAWSAVAQGRVAAEVGVREALSAWREPDAPPPGLWGVREGAAGTLGPRAGYRTRLRILGPEFRLLEGEGRVEPWAVRRRVGRVLWTLAPVARLGSARGAVEVGGRERLESGATVSGRGVTLDPDGWPGSLCDPYRAALDSLFPAGLLPATAPLPEADRRVPGLGLLSLDTLVALSTLTVTGRVTPVPEVEEGLCVPGVTNWGRPTDPSAPCGGRLVSVAASGSLVVEGGEGQGVLVVAGDLLVTAGARFSGVVVVGGSLAVDGDSRIEGLARAGGNLEVGDGSTVEARGCPVLRALEAAAAFRAPILPAGGSWVSPL